METIPYGKHIRVEYDNSCSWVSAKEIIKEIKRHVNNITDACESNEGCTYKVNGTEYQHKAEAILDELQIPEVICDIIYEIESPRKTYNIGVSRRPNDTHPTETDRTAYGGISAYKLVEILYYQPYIHRFPQNISAKQKDAVEIIAKASQLNREAIKVK